MTSGLKSRRIEPEFHSRIWGSPRLEPWFEPRVHEAMGERIGEVRFPAGELMIKFLFTSENLSVQVHPDDAYAHRHDNSRGKNEMWHILRADPGARIALGLKQPISPDQLIAASETGEIMDLLTWIYVHPGETYFVPAGTIHAIGAGVALCEIQQNSNVTYRLFDYGRKRELHLRQAKEVSRSDSHPGRCCPRDLGAGVQLLVECPYFTTYRAIVETPGDIAPQLHTRLLVVLEGTGRVNGSPVSPGNVFEDAGSDNWFVEPETPGDTGSMKLLLIR